MTEGFRTVEDCVDQMKGIGFGNDTNEYRKLMVRKTARERRRKVAGHVVGRRRDGLNNMVVMVRKGHKAQGVGLE